jgi:cytochrome d ubiquinol oxidase subunit I
VTSAARAACSWPCSRASGCWSWWRRAVGMLALARLVTGDARLDPIAVFFNNASWYELPHMIQAAYMVTGFSVASVHAVGLSRGGRDRNS